MAQVTEYFKKISAAGFESALKLLFYSNNAKIESAVSIVFVGIQTGLGFDSGEQAHFEVDQVQYHHHHHNPQCMYFFSQSVLNRELRDNDSW